MKNLIIFILILFFVNCSATSKKLKSNMSIKSYNELSSYYVSCTGYGNISSIGSYKGQLSFSFISQNDSSFFQFQDFLGRKILLMWLTPNSANAWNILENKRYDLSQIKNLFPLLSVVEPMSITKFLWGEESIYNSDDFKVLGLRSDNLSVIFEKSSQEESLINKAIFKDATNNQKIEILLKSRVPSIEFIDFDKIWKLMLI
tara:strand:- start:8391 stop:8996 length:606 start_codon:yes stop_codon:yes gene_type:complete